MRPAPRWSWTTCSPRRCYQKPLELGADCVVYSATKHIDGQGRCLGGVILGPDKFIEDNIHNLIRQTGPSMSPFNAWVLLKGLETLSVRVQRQTDTAAIVAVALAEHPKIKRMIYPGHPSHPQADIIHRQMKAGSTLVAFDIDGGKAAAFRFQDALKLVKISNNLGDAKSLITHPATTTHQRIAWRSAPSSASRTGWCGYRAALNTPTT